MVRKGSVSSTPCQQANSLPNIGISIIVGRTSGESDDVFTPAAPLYKDMAELKEYILQTNSGKYKLVQALSEGAAHSLEMAAEKFRKIHELKISRLKGVFPLMLH